MKYWYEDADSDRHGIPRQRNPLDDPAGQLAQMAADTCFDDLPADDVDMMKKCTLDALGCLIGGSSQRSVPDVAEAIRKRWGGKGDSPVLVYGFTAPAAEAAIVNGTMARALDFGDVHNTGGHISEYILPTLLTGLSLADGKKISGKEFITAFIVGAEWTARQHTACRFQYHPLGMPGACAWAGTTPALAKLLGLGKEEIWNAMGFSYTAHSIGEQEKVFEGCDSQRIHHGLFAANSVFAVELARSGLTAAHAIYYGDCGMFRYIGWDDLEPEMLTRDLGTYWHWKDGLMMKPFASCKFTHCVVSATLKLREKYAISYRDVEKIRCIVARNAGPCIQENRWHPETAGEAMFSIPYAVAHAIMRGDVFLDAFEEAELKDAEKNAFMQRIEVEISDDPSIGIFDGYTTEIYMKDGAVYRMKETDVLGGMTCPLSWEQIEAKYWKCVPYAAREVSQKKLEKIVYLCRHLEDVEDMNDLLGCLV